MRTFSKYIVAQVLFVFLTGCSTIKITSSWKANNLQSDQFKKLVVIAIVKGNDPDFRERMETHLSNDLKDLGFPAFTAVQLLGPRSLEGIDREQAYLKLRDVGVDRVLTVVLLDVKQEQAFVPDKSLYSDKRFQDDFWQYYSSYSEKLRSGGYYLTSTKFFWESKLYDLNKKELSYSVQTQAFNPESLEELAHEYGKAILKDMVKARVIEGKNSK